MFVIILFFINIFRTPYSGKNRYSTTTEDGDNPTQYGGSASQGSFRARTEGNSGGTLRSCTTTIAKHSCDFTGCCPHAGVDCGGGIYITEEGFICEALLEELPKVGPQYKVLYCALCQGHDDFSFQLKSEHPLTLEQYRQLADEKLPYGDYSEKAVTFFKVHILTSFWEHQRYSTLSLVYELLEQLEELEE